MPTFLYQWPLWITGTLMVVLFVGFAELCLEVVRRRILPGMRFGNEEGHFGGAMVHSMMVFYGLVAALLAINVYETYSEVTHIVSREASSLAALYRDAGGYPEPTRSELQGSIRSYVYQIIHEAWPLQRRGRIPRGGVDKVDQIQTALMEFEPTTEGQKLLHGETLRAYNEMVDARRLRVDANKEHLPGMMWALLVMGGIVCLFGACFFEVDDPRLHTLFLGLLATLMAMILLMTFAWDRPFLGDLGVSAESYEIIYDQLMKP